MWIYCLLVFLLLIICKSIVILRFLLWLEIFLLFILIFNEILLLLLLSMFLVELVRLNLIFDEFCVWYLFVVHFFFFLISLFFRSFFLLFFILFFIDFRQLVRRLLQINTWSCSFSRSPSLIVIMFFFVNVIQEFFDIILIFKRITKHIKIWRLSSLF